MKKILIISGGISKERAISLDTGKQVAKELKKNNYSVKITEPNFQLLDVIKKFKPNKKRIFWQDSKKTDTTRFWLPKMFWILKKKN